MLRCLVITLLITLVGCESTAIKNANSVRTKTQLNKDIQTPLDVPVVFYVDKSKPESGVNFFGKMEDAAELVVNNLFRSAEPLGSDQQFQYLITLASNSRWQNGWGNWKSEIDVKILDNQGSQLFTTHVTKTSSGGGPYDVNAIHNSFASAIKEALYQFFNTQGNAAMRLAESNYQSAPLQPVSIKTLLKEIKPSSSGTGFFIGNEGELITAAHVVNECLLVEIMHKGNRLPATVLHSSKLLDLAVLDTDYSNPGRVAIPPGKNTASILGKQIFVTGFPLSDLLSDYPSLTVGNVSSLGGLRGSKGTFQFSAPTQPGNSGGAIVDYSGNLVGVVSSTLNQSMLLKKSGTTSQNVNFGVEVSLLKKFLDNNNFVYKTEKLTGNFEAASAAAVEYTNQVLCYQ